MAKITLGLPYKGSKAAIAEDIVKKLPPGGRILDACCGGGAFLMAAAMSLKWDSVVGNDLNKATIALLDAVLIHKGQIDYEHPAPCSRVDFFHSLQRIENGDFDIQDCVNKYCASFGNDGKALLQRHGGRIPRTYGAILRRWSAKGLPAVSFLNVMFL